MTMKTNVQPIDNDCDVEMIDIAIRQRMITIFVPTVAPDERLKTISDDGGQVERILRFLMVGVFFQVSMQ